MAGINKVILVGNLGKDPEIRYLEGGTAVANFTLATSESFKDRTSGERKTNTEWHNVVVWRGLAEVTEKYLKKGMQGYIEGKLRTMQWQDKDGNNRYTTEIVADNLQMLGKREENSSHNNNEQNSENNQSVNATPSIESTPDQVDDLPF